MAVNANGASIPARSSGRPGHPEALKLAALELATNPDLSIAAIARRLKLPDGTVRGWINRARRSQEKEKGAAEATPRQSTTPEGVPDSTLPGKPAGPSPIRIGG